MKTLILAPLLLSSSAFANSYILCAKQADILSQKVSGYELEVSSEEDNFNGPVGQSWNLSLGAQAQWVKPSKNITAKSNGQDGVIEITIKQANAASGPVGTTYVIENSQDDEPVLKKYTMGGFAGKVLVGTFQCYGDND